MREILFRGKRVCNGAWLYGGFHSRFGRAFIIGCSKSFRIDGMDVIPETVGQFTGLTDKNGKRIFEGDIVKVTDDYGETNFPDGGVGDVGFYDGLWYVSGEVNNGLNDLTKVYYVEVIGNIHDNPELLEG